MLRIIIIIVLVIGFIICALGTFFSKDVYSESAHLINMNANAWKIIQVEGDIDCVQVCAAYVNESQYCVWLTGSTYRKLLDGHFYPCTDENWLYIRPVIRGGDDKDIFLIRFK